MPLLSAINILNRTNIILQWYYSNADARSSGKTFDLPTAFTTDTYAIVGSDNTYSSNSGHVALWNRTFTQYKIRANAPWSIIAIGY